MLFPIEKYLQNQEWQFSLRRLFRRVFLEDWLIKAIALAITLGLWLGVTGLRTPVTRRLNNVALRISVANDIETTNSPVQEVDIVITGDKRKIEQIKQSDLIATLDLTDTQAGDRTVQLTPQNVSVELPTGVKLDEIQPSKIAVKLEKVEEREIPVRAETEGSVAEGFEVYAQTVLPPKIHVRGPESFIKSLAFVSTEKINLENRQEDFTARQVPINVVNPKVTILDTVVDVSFKIGEKRVERLFIVPFQAENKKAAATVVLYGARSVLENLKPENLQIETLKNDAGETSTHLILPVDIQDKVEIRKMKVN